MGIELCGCQSVLLREIAMKEMKQKDIAMTYAMAMASSECREKRIDWVVVNTAIIERWSKSGLIRIKEQAWKIIEEKSRESAERN